MDNTQTLKLSFDQECALKLMLEGKNCFLHGNAGTGKSTVIKEFINRSKKNIVIVAPTGVAAVNVGGQTIHSFFMLPPSLMTEDTVQDIPWRRAREKISNVEVVVIDEISMVRSDMLWAIDHRCKECARGVNKKMPFGGKQVIACGDFFQLPPVVTSKIEEDWLEDNFGGEYAFDAQVWKDAKFESIALTEPFRQKEDKKFLTILDKVREGCLDARIDSSNKDVLGVLNSECPQDKVMDKFPIRLCTTNKEAQLVNTEEQAKIDAPATYFKAVVKGKFNVQDYPTEAELVLKVGCRVMVLCNKHDPDGGFFYVNGDCGEVLAIKEDYELSKVQVKFDNGYVGWISCREWKNMKYVLEADRLSGRKIVRQEEIGSFTQLPFRLAYATTIHKSQGMTLESIDLRLGNGCFAHGQLYTALSRARSLAGLRLERPIDPEDLILDDRVVAFYKSLEKKPLDFLDSQCEKVDVPLEHIEKVKAYLSQLSGQAH